MLDCEAPTFEKLFDKALHGLNSVSTKGTSTLFVAKNFQALVVPSAIRSVARHDHFIMYYDRFGNFTYAPKVFEKTESWAFSAVLPRRALTHH